MGLFGRICCGGFFVSRLLLISGSLISGSLLSGSLLSALAALEIPDPSPADDRILGGMAVAACSSHGDEPGFQQRATAIVQRTGALDMAPYRRGHWVNGGDPGTYTLPIAIGKILSGQDAAAALAIVNDERSAKEQYHFAAAGWSRVIPLFGDRLKQSTVQKMTAIPGNWLGGRGTDNHEAMWRTSAITLSSYQGGNARGLDWLQTYVRNLYAAGQAEWDSPRYQPYVLKGLLNIYDFSKDERARAWAKAGLDYIAAAYALRNTGNIYAGPTSRGNSHSPLSDNMNAIGWLWWGGPGDPGEASRLLRPAVFAATSTYRPPGIIGRIARREVPQLPFTVEQGIANYWTGLDSQTLPVIANEGHATIWVSQHATLGTAWYADDVCSQMVHLRAAATNADGSNATSIIAGWPGLKDGKRTLSEGHCAVFGRKDNPQNHPYVTARHGQFAQVEHMAVCLAQFPAGTPDPWTYVTTRGTVSQQQGWYVFAMGAAMVGVFPLGEAETTREGNESMIRIRGQRSGFVLAMWDATALKSAGLRSPFERMAVDTSEWAAEQRIGLRTITGTTAEVGRQPGQHFPKVLINGSAPRRDAVYRSPYVNSQGTQLALSDGRHGYVIDVSGEVPRYLPLPDTQNPAGQNPASQDEPERAMRKPRAATQRPSSSAPSAEQQQAWRQQIVALTQAAVDAGRTPRFTHARLGETEVPEVQGDRLVLSARGARMAMPIASIGWPELASLCGHLARRGGAEAHALHAACLRMAGDTGMDYRAALVAAGDQAAAIEAAWAAE